MTPTMARSDLVASLLAVAFSNQLVAADAETGIAQLAARADRPADPAPGAENALRQFVENACGRQRD